VKETNVSGENYYYLAGRFNSLSSDGKLGYLLLSSNEQSLHGLHSTQEALVLVSSLGILLGTFVVWFLVRRVTQPLRALSHSAEAVGKGDFSQKVEVTTSDECGELAAVFNQMTENLKRSREQLESTVETLKTTQAQLIQSEKLSGIGEFVAGVAHELNNPLTSVMGFSELLQKADTDPQHRRYLDMIHKSSLRCQKIVQNLLSFARRHKPERKLSNINELVEGAVEILQYQMRTSNIEVVSRLDPHLPKAMVDPQQRAPGHRSQSTQRLRADYFRNRRNECARDVPGQRSGHTRGRFVQGLRSVLYHQRCGQGDRPWPEPLLWHR
jgi:signal transduction histidine kinase